MKYFISTRRYNIEYDVLIEAETEEEAREISENTSFFSYRESGKSYIGETFREILKSTGNENEL